MSVSEARPLRALRCWRGIGEPTRREPRAESRRAERRQRAESREPRAEERRAEEREPRAETDEPRGANREEIYVGCGSGSPGKKACPARAILVLWHPVFPGLGSLRGAADVSRAPPRAGREHLGIPEEGGGREPTNSAQGHGGGRRHGGARVSGDRSCAGEGDQDRLGPADDGPAGRGGQDHPPGEPVGGGSRQRRGRHQVHGRRQAGPGPRRSPVQARGGPRRDRATHARGMPRSGWSIRQRKHQRHDPGDQAVREARSPS